MSKQLRLGDILVARQIVSEYDLNAALEEQKRSGARLGKLLIHMGLIEEGVLCTLLSEQLGIPFIDMSDVNLQREALEAIPEALCKKFQLCGLYFDDGELVVGTPDPGDILGFDEVVRVTGLSIRPVILLSQQLQSVINIAFARDDEIRQLADEIAADTDSQLAALARYDPDEEGEERPVGRFLQRLLAEAVQAGASDIHIEPDKDVLRIRQRIDGRLTEQVINTTVILSALIIRLKLMANLDIAEKRRPQDGRFEAKVGAASVDVRMSTMPVQHGEAIVLRLLDARQGLIPLGSLGLVPDDLARLRAHLKLPYGLLLVTGPTGSGKTTTLYSALSEMNNPDTKVITVEDPVEFSLPRVNQVQVSERIGLDFPTVLRAALRQDPDMLLVGEIRDSASADIALRASLTGHMVLSTLHTNDAPSAPLRLMDMGIEPYLIASSLTAVVAQRLLRRVCARCAVSYTPNADERDLLEQIGYVEHTNVDGFRLGSGCVQCHNTGYRGRIGVYEILDVDPAVAESLRRSDIAAYHGAVRKQHTYRPIWRSSLELAIAGETSIAEALRYVDVDSAKASLLEHRGDGEAA